MESYFRKDKVPYMGFFFAISIWASSSFINCDMINIFTLGFSYKRYFVQCFYCGFTVTILIFSLLKFGVVPILMILIHCNFILYGLLLLLSLLSVVNHKFYYIIFSFWGFLSALNLIATLYLSSYNRIGLKAFLFGISTSYLIAFIFAYKLCYSNIDINKSNVFVTRSFILFKFLLSLLVFPFFKSAINDRFSYEYHDFLKQFKFSELITWFSSNRNVKTWIKETMLSIINVKNLVNLIKEEDERTKLGRNSLIIFSLVSITNTFFLPSLMSSKALSKFFINDLLVSDHLSSFMGIILAIYTYKCNKRSCMIFAVLYPFYLSFSILIFAGTSIRFTKLCFHPKIAKFILICSGFIGNWIFVSSLLQFFDRMLSFECESPDKCCEYDSFKCLCSIKMSEEKCSTGNTSTSVSASNGNNCKICIPRNNEDAYRGWAYGDCLCCSTQSTTTTTGSSCAGGQNSNGSCYLMRNCIVTACAYCDLNVLFECVKIDHCSCTTTSSSSTGNNSVCLCLNSIKYELIACENTQDSNLNGKLCCSSGSSNCCCCCCCTCTNGGEKNCGKHFKISKYSKSSCCHYDLKLLLSYKEINTKFYIGKTPFDNKFDPISCIVFSNCCNTTNNNNHTCGIIKITNGNGVTKDNGYVNCNGSNNNGKCCIKIVPCNLPYHFRKKDITRSECISLLLLSIFIFCLVRCLLSVITSYTVDKTIKFNMPFSEIKRNASQIIGDTKFPYESDIAYAKVLSPSFIGTDDELIGHALEIEKIRLDSELKLAKLVMTDSRFSSLDKWLQSEISKGVDLFEGTPNHVQYISKFTKCLHRVLLKYALFLSNSISSFLDWQDKSSKWEIEWRHFGMRHIQNIQDRTHQASVLLKMGFFSNNSKLQKEITDMHVNTWKNVTKDTKEFEVINKNLRLLENNLSSATTVTEIFNRKLQLWDYKAVLLRKWNDDGTILFNWESFIQTFDDIKVWKENFLPLYFEAHDSRLFVEDG